MSCSLDSYGILKFMKFWNFRLIDTQKKHRKPKEENMRWDLIIFFFKFTLEKFVGINSLFQMSLFS